MFSKMSLFTKIDEICGHQEVHKPLAQVSFGKELSKVQSVLFVLDFLKLPFSVFKSATFKALLNETGKSQSGSPEFAPHKN